jgi:putative protein-disulfide isomerase
MNKNWLSIPTLAALLITVALLLLIRSYATTHNHVNPVKNKNVTLTYVFDPLCGWCYGFSPQMKKLHDKYKTELNIEVLCGGMVLGKKSGPIGEVAPFIKEAYTRVEDYTGVKFGTAFLNDVMMPGTRIFSSEEPCIAFVTLKQLKPEKAFEFSHLLLNALYRDGLDFNKPESYKAIAEKSGIDYKDFLNAYQKNKATTYQEFERAAGFGVSGYPSVLITINGKTSLISSGYKSFEELDQALNKLI